MHSAAYLKNYPKNKYVPKTKEELKKYIVFEIRKQGGVNVDLNMIDTSNITDMSYLFDRFYSVGSVAQNIQTLDISGWDTSNVTDMAHMFEGCESLKTLNVNGWDTSNVSDMSFMFKACSSLETLDVSGWDTSNVENMCCMFSRCSSLQTLDVSGWNTSNVKNMSCMFYGCRKLKANITTWDRNRNGCAHEEMLKGTRNIKCTWDNAEELMENKRYNRR